MKDVIDRLDKEIEWFKNNHESDSDWTSTAILDLLETIRKGSKSEK